jgi:hypothetical protein
METSEVIMTVLGAAGFTGVSTGFVLKVFLEAGIKESIGGVYKKQLEDRKSLLKNSEKIFQYKLDASKRLYKILHELLPKRTNPDMDSYEAYGAIAGSFSSHEDALDDFLCDYQATLSPAILERVRKAVNACSDGKIDFNFDSSTQGTICSDAAIEKAEELNKSLLEAVEMLRKEVHQMIYVPHG